jgi:hypothetical protein
MSKPAADCCDCKHWREGLAPYDRKPRHGVFRIWPDGWYHACLRDHRPRFYRIHHVEGSEYLSVALQWGWKRRCPDFTARAAEEER